MEIKKIEINKLNIFISSTYKDLIEERKKVDESLRELDTYPINMIYFGSLPGKPQEESLREAAEVDILVSIIAYRYGTVPPSEQKSITEQEYDEYCRKKQGGKHVLVFFPEKSEGDTLSKFVEQDPEAKKKLQAFKKALAEKHTPSYYANADDLARKVVIAVERERRKIKTAEPEIAFAEIDDGEIISKYSNYIKKKYEKIQIFKNTYFLFKDIYVSLKLEFKPENFKELDHGQILKIQRQGRLPFRLAEVIGNFMGNDSNCEREKGYDGKEQKSLEIEQVLAENEPVLIVGDAGSGKTTLFKHLSARYADFATWIPVLLPIKGMNEHDPLSSFSDLLKEEPYLFPVEYLPQLEMVLKSFWQKGKVLLLLDGLDEVKKGDFDRVVEFLNKFETGNNKVLVSCRDSSKPGNLDDRRWWVYKINPFIREDREKYIKKYFYQEKDIDKAQRLIGLLEGRKQLVSLGQVPLLMGLICYIYEKDETLPEERRSLYRVCIEELLMRREDIQQFKDFREFKKEFLEYVAYRFFKNGEEKNRECFADNKLMEILSESMSQSKLTVPPVAKGKSLVRELVEVNSLLLQAGYDSYCFPHRSFQEYFAACYLFKEGKVGFEEVVETLSGDAYWVEMICLYAGFLDDATELVNRLGEKERLDLVLRIIPNVIKLDWSKLNEKLNWKIRRGAVEKLVLPEPEKGKSEETVELLSGILKSDPNGNVRYSALIGLEKIGTSSALKIVKNTYIIPPEVLKECKPYKYQARGREFSINQPGMPPNMVLVPGGTFTLGESTDKVTVKDFYMSVFPVTNWEFKRFINADGYQNKNYWTKKVFNERRKRGKPTYWSDPRFNQGWQPVVGVNFYEAVAYCKWMTEFLKSGIAFRLPTEAEWEWAARGLGGDEYAFEGSWNDDIPRWDSYKEYEKGLTYGASRVNTVYRKCVSDFGLFDMSGNVWEWTSSFCEKGGSLRVLRGGSWRYGFPAGLRSAYRFRGIPAICFAFGGFRLLRTVP